MKPTMQFKWFEVSNEAEGPLVLSCFGWQTTYWKLRQLWTDGTQEEWRDIEIEWQGAQDKKLAS